MFVACLAALLPNVAVLPPHLPPPHPFAPNLQALTFTEDMMSSRVDFLLQQGMSQEEVGRAVLAHPQVLHYKIDSMRERVDYLHNVGLTQVGWKRAVWPWCVQVWAWMHRSVQFAHRGQLRPWRRCGGSPTQRAILPHSCTLVPLMPADPGGCMRAPFSAAPLAGHCWQPGPEVALPHRLHLRLGGRLCGHALLLPRLLLAVTYKQVRTALQTDAAAALAVAAVAHMPALLLALQYRATQCSCMLQSRQFSPVLAAFA